MEKTGGTVGMQQLHLSRIYLRRAAATVDFHNNCCSNTLNTMTHGNLISQLVEKHVRYTILLALPTAESNSDVYNL